MGWWAADVSKTINSSLKVTDDASRWKSSTVGGGWTTCGSEQSGLSWFFFTSALEFVLK